MLSKNITVSHNGTLNFAGYNTIELAKKYSTPLYLMDEDMIRERIRVYKKALCDFFPEGSVPEYASKAFSCKRIYEIANEEGINVDVVSVGELYTAFKAGFPMERCFYHGNSKSVQDIEFAIDKGIGCFVVDNADELSLINNIAENHGVMQKIILRVTPGIDPHTHKKISTGSVESKFGIPIDDDALEATRIALNCKNISLEGFHCHIGSQIFESEPFVTAAKVMIKFMAQVRDKLGFTATTLNLGGGFGVQYTENDPVIDYRARIKEVAVAVNEISQNEKFEVPKILMEPGRSLVADAGMTLYTVNNVKEIKDYRNYVSIDGGMTDNPRYALYESEYTVYNASKASQEANYVVTIAGRCCESGDLIQENVRIAKPEVNDIIAVATTGAYNYSMASNYNRVARPCVVMLNSNRDYIAVKRESLDDLIRLDV
ncbi:MAG: diaminopimelate decarboxylase [Acutalibacteraceae bacterium]|nr:diaminopimelate decarboxylase [Acutalibacteraceae bacterium]